MRIVLIVITAIGLCVAWNCASDPPLPSETDTLKLITEGGVVPDGRARARTLQQRGH